MAASTQGGFFSCSALLHGRWNSPVLLRNNAMSSYHYQYGKVSIAPVYETG